MISGAAGGVLTLAGALITAWLQRTRDERGQWFERTKWAEQLSVDSEPSRAAKGQEILSRLLKRQSPADRDADIISVLASTPRLAALEAGPPPDLDDVEFEVDTGLDEERSGDDSD
ncbi:hypothetical protein [Nakamurella endophytica]|uniref:hypothetical protein n=1 Tax=Nakamurella endophytica TaxID=1748367 RepID=UPI00166F1F9A|nr:hypothetical protein [Nakamurella endophytica]